MAKYDWKIEPRDEDWSDDTYAYFLIHINIKRMAEYLNKEFKKDWWFKADFGQDYVWIVAEHNDYPVRLFFNFDEGGWADIVRHYTDGASYTDNHLGSWHYAKYDIDYSFAMIKENIKEYFNRFEESKKSNGKSLKESKSIWYIAFYGSSGDGYVGYDNEPTNDFDNAMQFDSKKEAEKEMKILQKEWDSDLRVEEFSLEENKKLLKEKLNDNGDVRFNDIYSCELTNILEVNVYDKELYEQLREQDLVLYAKGEYDGIDWKMFQDEIGYLKDDFGSSNFSMRMTLANGTLVIDIVDDEYEDIIMEYRLEPKIVM